MSLYEQRLADDKAEIRGRIVEMGHAVEDAVSSAVEALLAGDHARSYALVLGDLPINRESRAIDAACHSFVARHLPSAGHLRFVSAVMRMNVELERIGDYAVSIARQAVQLEQQPSDKVAADMREIAKEACTMLHDAIAAFSHKDAELARKTKPLAKQVGRDYDKIFEDLVSDSSRSVRDTAGLLAVFNKLERVSDQAKNICERTLFELLGETKPPKRYQILFVDARDTTIAPLAVMLARKAFPDSGDYDSAGVKPGDALSEELLSLAEELGLDSGDAAPTLLDNGIEALSKYHVVVWLNGDASKHIPRMPYETALLTWELPKLADAWSTASRGGAARRPRAELSAAGRGSAGVPAAEDHFVQGVGRASGPGGSLTGDPRGAGILGRRA